MRRGFDFSAPTCVMFGVGRSTELPVVLGAGRWGVLATRNQAVRAALPLLFSPGASGDVEPVALPSVSPNPRLEEIERALDRAWSAEVCGVVAVGGGSVIDAAKLLSVALRYGASAKAVLADLASVTRAARVRDCRLVVVPTAAGTGAEVSKGAIVTEDSGRKTAARGSVLVPDVAIIDPRLALSLSGPAAVEIGFDAIAHATETFLSLAATPVTDILSLAALDAVPATLVRIRDQPGDLESRTTLALHSWLMGYNLAHASTCLPHRMQYAVARFSDSSHQRGLAALYPAWLRAVTARAPERVGVVAERVRGSLTRVGLGEHLGGEPAELFRRLLNHLGLPVSLQQLGLEQGQVDQLAQLVDGRIDLDPTRPSLTDLRDVFAAALGG